METFGSLLAMANLILTAFSYPNSLRVSGAPFLYKWTACIDYSPTGGRTESTIHGSPRGKTTHFLIQSNGYGIALLLYVNKTTWSRLHVMKQVVFTHIYIYIHVTTCIYIYIMCIFLWFRCVDSLGSCCFHCFPFLVVFRSPLFGPFALLQQR